MAKPVFYRDWDELPVMLTLPQVALICARTTECVRKWAVSGKIPAAQNPDGSWLFDKALLREWFRQRGNDAARKIAS